MAPWWGSAVFLGPGRRLPGQLTPFCYTSFSGQAVINSRKKRSKLRPFLPRASVVQRSLSASRVSVSSLSSLRLTRRGELFRLPTLQRQRGAAPKFALRVPPYCAQRLPPSISPPQSTLVSIYHTARRLPRCIMPCCVDSSSQPESPR